MFCISLRFEIPESNSAIFEMIMDVRIVVSILVERNFLNEISECISAIFATVMHVRIDVYITAFCTSCRNDLLSFDHHYALKHLNGIQLFLK